MYYTLKLPFKIEKQKLFSPTELRDQDIIYTLKFLHLCLESAHPVGRLQFALGVSLEYVLRWMCLLFITGNYNVNLRWYFVSSGCNM